jgi:hypothetical protein
MKQKLCTLLLFDDNGNGVEDWDDEWCLILQHLTGQREGFPHLP